MSNQTISLNEPLYRYLCAVSLRETPLLRQLREETAQLPEANMQIAPEQGQFMAFLVRLMGARRAIEIGVFTGYSALAVAEALPEEGHLVACDVHPTWTAMAKRYWQHAGVAHKIELRLAPALATLDELLAQHAVNSFANGFDFAFIDADKENYIAYYEKLLLLMRSGGVIAVDNVLWGGAVIDEQKQDAATVAIRQFNQHVRVDERVFISLVPIGDGVTLLMKK